MFALLINTKAQDVIARQHNGQTYFHYGTQPYSDIWLQSVFNACSSGDTVYLPGVTFQCSNPVTLSAGIVLIGTGIHPDSVSVYGANLTKILSTNSHPFYIINGANNAELHGITFGGTIFKVGSTAANQNLSGLKLVRCEFDEDVVLAFNVQNTSSNFTIQNCYFQTVLGIKDVQNVTVTGSVIGYGIPEGNQSTTFANCLFLNTGLTSVFNSTNVLYRDNIFLFPSTGATAINEASRFYNNLFVLGSGGTLSWGANAIHNGTNLTNNILSDVLLSPPATNPYSVFSFAANYHLNPSGTNYATYNTMSSTGGQIGLFGGNPNTYWKEGVVPYNPHWRELIVPANSVNGMLNITLKAAAQTY